MRLRALRFEMGEMRKRLDNVVVSHTVQKLNEANLDLAFLQRVEFEAFYERGTTDQTVSPNERVLAIQKSQSGLRTGPVGSEYLRSILAAVKFEIQEQGNLFAADEAVAHRLLRQLPRAYLLFAEAIEKR